MAIAVHEGAYAIGSMLGQPRPTVDMRLRALRKSQTVPKARGRKVALMTKHEAVILLLGLAADVVLTDLGRVVEATLAYEEAKQSKWTAELGILRQGRNTVSEQTVGDLDLDALSRSTGPSKDDALPRVEPIIPGTLQDALLTFLGDGDKAKRLRSYVSELRVNVQAQTVEIELCPTLDKKFISKFMPRPSLIPHEVRGISTTTNVPGRVIAEIYDLLHAAEDQETELPFREPLGEQGQNESGSQPEATSRKPHRPARAGDNLRQTEDSAHTQKAQSTDSGTGLGGAVHHGGHIGRSSPPHALVA